MIFLWIFGSLGAIGFLNGVVLNREKILYLE